jgi:hypothetical protein
MHLPFACESKISALPKNALNVLGPAHQTQFAHHLYEVFTGVPYAIIFSPYFTFAQLCILDGDLGHPGFNGTCKEDLTVFFPQ